jgi:DUF1680 family protein
VVASGTQSAAVVLPTEGAAVRVRPLDGRGVRLGSGFWGDRLRLNSEQTIPHGLAQLRAVGNLENLRLAADASAAGRREAYRALGMMFDGPFPFLDSDVYKWLEAVGWVLSIEDDPALARAAGEVIELVAAAQQGDGYLNSFVQVVAPDRRYRDLAWGHELYTYGHLLQAAVAWQRAVGDDRLLNIATRAADSIDRELGSSGRDAIDGHPGIEMALVELYRTTGTRRYLDLAARQLALRGRGLLGQGRFGARYWQDHAPVREAPTVAGHAVRQLYLDSGAVDVAVELGDGELLAAVERRWADMVATRSYLTGGLGSRHRDESFGDPHELPPDRAYAETCAGIASVMLGWRLLLATGNPTYADVIERTLFNAVLPGLALDGSSFFYVNPLQRRAAAPLAAGQGERAPWFPCACCPPNLMRLISSWPQYLATRDEGGIQVHQYASGEIATDGVAGGRIRIAVETGYPWSGDVRVRILESPAEPWRLSLRVPAWSRQATLDGRSVEPGLASAERRWNAGDELVLALDVSPRVTAPHPRVDAVRGCLALERGPLVYAIEDADLPSGVDLEGVAIAADIVPREVERPDLGPGVVGLTFPAVGVDGRPIEAAAIPYHAWANRSPGAMRVWIPRAA